MATNASQLTVEEQICQCETGWFVKMEKQNLNDQDVTIIVREAIINKQCSGLWLGSNNISSVGAITIADALRNNTTLQYLYLSDNKITDQGAQALSAVLSDSNVILKDLFLGNNNITDEGVACLANMLKTNKTLKQLNLSSNKVSDRGVQYLDDALNNQQNNSLEKLYLNSNKLITDNGVPYLAEMLKEKRKLNTLWIQGCSLSENGKGIVRSSERSKKGNYLYS